MSDLKEVLISIRKKICRHDQNMTLRINLQTILAVICN